MHWVIFLPINWEISMNHIQAYIAAHSLDADDVTLTGTCVRRLAYSKGNVTVGGVDFYALDVLKIVVNASNFREELTSGPEFDNAVDLLEGSDGHPLLFVEAPVGSAPEYPELELSVSYDKALRWWEASEHLSNVVIDGADDQVQDARWQVFSLTNVFEQHPCSRETFDELTHLQEQSEKHVSFREFYAEWLVDQPGTAAPGI
jgi:hypothetical protein